MWVKFKLTLLVMFISCKSYVVFGTSPFVMFLFFTLLPLIEGDGSIKGLHSNTTFNLTNVFRTVKRSVSSTRCSSREDCDVSLPGSVCLNETCSCPQGYLPSSDGKIGCFQTGRHLGQSCNVSVQCGDDLACLNDMCTCPEGFQLFQTQGMNLCLLWHRPTRLVDRCRNNEDCLPLDPNYMCRKRWCQCSNGFQLFETMLFGLKHRCFKTFKRHCHNTSQCTKLADTSEQFCVCLFGYCHCIPNSNTSDIFEWVNEKPTWYQRWKKDLILATRLLFITIILFFVPCFVYVTLGVRERSRLFFSQVVQPSRNSGVHQVQYSRARHSRSRSLQGSAEAHNVEIALSSRGVNSRLVENPRTVTATRETPLSDPRRPRAAENEAARKEEDPPPSYDEIMRIERVRDAPPPPYQDL